MKNIGLRRWAFREVEKARGDGSEKGSCILFEQRNWVTMAEITRSVRVGTSAVAMALKQKEAEG